MSGLDILPVATGRQTRRWLWAELRSRSGEVTLTAISGLVAAATAVVPVYILGVLVDRIIDRSPASVIVMIGIIVTAAALLGGIANGMSNYLIGRLGAVALADLREACVETTLSLPTTAVERAGRGDIISRLSTDVATIAKAVSDVIPTMFAAVLLALLSLIAMLGLDWRLGIAGAVAIPFYVLALRWYLPRSAPRYAEERRAIGERSQVLMESMVGSATVHAYGMQAEHQSAIEASSARVRDISIGVFALFTRFVGRINRAEFIGLTAIVIIGFWLVRDGVVTVGQTSAAALLFHRLFNPISSLLFTFDEAQDAGASLARLVGLMNLSRADTSPPGPVTEQPRDGVLDLADLQFSYDGEHPVVRGVSIRIETGQRVALVGSTGAGKSTVARLAAGSLVPQRGSVYIGGVPLAALSAARRSRHVAIVSQEVHVFAGPLVDDLRLANPSATEADMRAALTAVGADEWVSTLPDEIDTIVGEGGHRLTSAQAQQLALARVMLVDPVVAILDEATAEAGSQGARELERAAAAVTAGRTSLIIAHRLTQAASADRIVVMEHGSVVEEGAHDELLSAGGRYAALWSAWIRSPNTAT